MKRLWQYRELFYFLTLRDIKVRYKQAIFGFGWAILSPVILALVFWLVFDIFLKVESGPIPYLLLVFTKLTFWNFFSQSVSAASLSITANANLISRSKFPREVLVLSTVVVRLVDLLASFAVLVVLMFFFKIGVSFQVLWLIPILFLEVVLVIGLGLIFASLNVYFRDISVFIPLLIIAWLFVTPVIYTLDSVSSKYHLFLSLNPMTGIVEGIRKALLLQAAPEFTATVTSAITSILILLFGYFLFKKLEKGFADVI